MTTLFGVPTYTFPFAIIGVMNLLSAKLSRPFAAWLLLYNSVARFVAS
jgi:hypothetical protein